jgi:hypothetical protein
VLRDKMPVLLMEVKEFDHSLLKILISSLIISVKCLSEKALCTYTDFCRVRGSDRRSKARPHADCQLRC